MGKLELNFPTLRNGVQKPPYARLPSQNGWSDQRTVFFFGIKTRQNLSRDEI